MKLPERKTYAQTQINKARAYLSQGRDNAAQDAAARALSSLQPHLYPTVAHAMKEGNAWQLINEAEQVITLVNRAADVYAKG